MSLLNPYLLNILHQMPKELLYWIAGFLDGDGHICCRIKVKSDYRYGYQLKPEIGFTQLARRADFFFPLLKKTLGDIGTIRTKGQSSQVIVYEITNLSDVYTLMFVLEPYLLFKRKQAKYVLDILLNYDLAMQDPGVSVTLCRKAHRIAMLNDSKKRSNHTSAAVKCLKQRHQKKKMLVPAWILQIKP